MATPNSFLRFTFLALPAVLCLVACTQLSERNDDVGVAPVQQYDEPYVLAPLDEIVIHKAKGSSVTLKLTADDPVDYPDGDSLKAIGRTPGDVTAMLKKRDGDITRIDYNEYQGNRITVTGEVNIQTNFTLQDSPMRVLDAVASAGGFTPLADSSDVVLTRNNAGKVQVFRLDLHSAQEGQKAYFNILLVPGDRIYIPKSFL